MFPRHTSRRPCLCLGGHSAQRPSWTKHPVRSDVHLFRPAPVWCGYQPHRVRMIAPVCPTCTRCGHGCVIISVTHLASLLHGCPTQVHGVVRLLPHASRMRLCVACPPRVARMHNTRGRSWFVHSGTSLCLVCPAMSDTHVVCRCPTHHSSQWFRPSLVHAAHTRSESRFVCVVVLHRTSRSLCLVDSERPTTAHPCK